jgi:hypothetical protein
MANRCRECVSECRTLLGALWVAAAPNVEETDRPIATGGTCPARSLFDPSGELHWRRLNLEK